MIKGILNFIQVNVGFGFDVESKQALQYFRDKGLRTSFSYADVTAQEHQTAFTVAKMMDIDLLKDVQDSLYAALAEGLTFDQWKDRIIPTLQANGWWGRQAVVDPITGKTVIAELGSARRLQTIFRTNMQSAYAVGQWQKIQEQAKEAPYLMYDAVDDFRTRPQHRAWDNKILPITATFWRTHTPPNGWGCRCGVIQLSQDDINSMGLSVSDDPDIKWVNWKNPRTGKIERIPEGIDAGFQINAGMEREKYLKKLAREKAEAIADDLMRDAAKVGLTKSSNAAKNQIASLGQIDSVGGMLQPQRTDWHDMPDVIVNATLKDAANHPDYSMAKNGNTDAALQVASDLIKPESIDKLIEIAGDTNPILVSVHAEESVSVNWIPSAMAVVIRDKTGWDIDRSIVQVKKVGRTSAPDGFYRIAVTPTFAGDFPSGRAAIIMDDTLTQGGTLANLKGHIESQGGLVVGAIALTGKQYSAKIAISVETLISLRDRYGQLEEWFVGYFGYGFDKLTESEAKYILGSKKDAEFVKGRLIAAREGQGD